MRRVLIALPLLLLPGCIEAPVVDRWGRALTDAHGREVTRSWPDLDGSEPRTSRERSACDPEPWR